MATPTVKTAESAYFLGTITTINTWYNNQAPKAAETKMHCCQIAGSGSKNSVHAKCSRKPKAAVH
jgi:hypothetical protein